MANYVSYSDATELMTAIANKLNEKVDTSDVGSANGVAELDANGRVPSSQLPSYVDDVLEYADLAHFPATGETGKIYIAEDTNKTYRWSGLGYAEISESLALGETSSTAYAGNKGKANADAITAIKDGTNLDSFADVEDAFNYLTFEGTQADWNLLSTADKKKYKQAIFTDDYDDNPVGNLNALTTTDKSSCVGAINEVNGKIPKGLVEKLTLFSVYGYENSSINIDTINNGFGYMMCITNGAGFSGTFPSGLDCNRALLMGLSLINHNNNLVIYGVQIAIGFGSSKIAIRNARYSESGSAWGAWSYITP